jgi:hypothetical protein
LRFCVYSCCLCLDGGDNGANPNWQLFQVAISCLDV